MANQVPTPIVRALRPPLTEVEHCVRSVICRDIKDETLRRSMLENNRISTRLFDVALIKLGIPHKDEFAAFDQQDKLAFVLQHDRALLIRSLGLAAESQRVARHLFENTLPSGFQDIPREAIQKSLRYRDISSNSQEEPVTLHEVQASGARMLAHWVWALPPHINARAAIALKVMDAECIPLKDISDFADRVISDLMSDV